MAGEGDNPPMAPLTPSPLAAPAPLRSPRRGLPLPVLAVLAAAGLLLAVWAAAWHWRLGVGEAQLQADGQARLAGEAGSLAQLFDKHRHLPRLLALDPRLAETLRIAAATDARPAQRDAAADRANRHLAAVSQLVDLEASYLMDTSGRVLAASNWDRPSSFVGWRYTFRPYFQDAMATGSGVFYAVGVTTEAPGLFLSQAIRGPRGEVQGVVVVKISLAAVEQAWAAASTDALALADARGVLFLAARPDWRYRSLLPLSEGDRQALAGTRQYGRHGLQPLPALAPLQAGWQAEAGPPGAPGHEGSSGAWAAQDGAHRHLLMAQRIAPWGWTLVLQRDLGAVRRAAAIEAGAATLLAALVLAGLGLWRLQRRRLVERRAAAVALQAAHTQLEQRLGERTAALTEANQALQQRVQALHEAERILQATQDQAVQAGKLAVLGQVAASVTHEINQPLAALATAAGNGLKQLDRARLEDLRASLQLIGQLAERLGAIVGQLKGFARPGAAQLQPVAVADALGMATLMLAQRLRSEGVALHTRLAPDAMRVQADRTRLEQVLVNLLRNALDAMAAAPPAARLAGIEVSTWREADGRVALQVRDHGPGLSGAVQDHLFEPFFTTRGRGEGLGLGLAISRAIVQGLGGELSGHNASAESGGGACFTLRLPAGQPTP